MRLVVVPDPEALAAAAAELMRDRVTGKPDLAMAVPAGRTPRRMYALLRGLQEKAPVDYSRMRVFAIDELCTPAPPDGYFWQQVHREFLTWAGVPEDRCHPFRVDREDLEAVCRAYEATIVAGGGLDLVMLGLGPNAHLASNEPGTPADSMSRPVALLPETVAYILTDGVNLDSARGRIANRAVTLGLGTLLAAREVVVLVSGAAKRPAVRRMLQGPVGPDTPASVLQQHPGCTVIADRDAAG